MLMFIHTSCKDLEKEMLVSTGTSSDVTATSARISGEIIDPGNGVIEHGHCYAKTPHADLRNQKTELGSATAKGVFVSTLSNLEAGTTYYVKAYLRDHEQTVYGNEISFETLPLTLPVITTTEISNLTQNSASSGGNISYDGGTPVTARGVCWRHTFPNPTTADNKTENGTGEGPFVSDLTGLNPATTYYLRAYATNSTGTAYGNEISFTTYSPPAATTSPASFVTNISATLNGTVNAYNSSTIVSFEYGPTTSYGSSVTADQTPVGGSTAINVSANITGLDPGTLYHFRVTAESSYGKTYGDDLVFTTAPVSVNDRDGNAYNTVTIGTQVWLKENLSVKNYNNGEPIGSAISYKETCSNVAAQLQVIIDGGAGGMTLLEAEQSSIITSPQRAAIENLLTQAGLTNVSNYTIVQTNIALQSISDSVPPSFGFLYSWEAVNDSRNVCPAGWHVPSDEEWTTLVNHLGGESTAGGKMKEPGTSLWLNPNTGATNESGFTAQPAGYYSSDGYFTDIFRGAFWWSSTENNGLDAWHRYIMHDQMTTERGSAEKTRRLSVRCVWD